MFTSFFFIFLFLPLTLGGTFILRRYTNEYRLVVGWLFFSSLFFYFIISEEYLPLLLISMSVNYVISLRMAQIHSSCSRKNWFIAGLVFNIACLALFKYGNFITQILIQGSASHGTEIPVGISFYTFTQIAFLCDLYSRRIITPHSPLEFGLFVVYFPHLVAGPVLYHADIVPQFSRPRFAAMWGKDIVSGGLLFLIGLMKKLLLADQLAPTADGIFQSAELGAVMTFWEAWIGLFAYSFQLYFDFSGYSDMALGIALLMGVTIPANFMSPYRATSIIDFWRRWHISLSTFLRNYLYIPLGGNRFGEIRRYANIFVTMVLGGIWHGAGFGFLFWGVIHGVAIMVNHLWTKLNPINLRKPMLVRPIAVGAGWLVTMLVVVQAWAFFRAETLSAAILIVKTSWGLEGIGLPSYYANHAQTLNDFLGVRAFNTDGAFLTGVLGDIPGTLRLLAFSLLIVIVLPTSQNISNFIANQFWGPDDLLRRGTMMLITIICGLLFGFCVLQMQQVSPFIYGNF